MPSSKVSLPLKAVRIIVSGKVQGVGFRQALAQQAREKNITGWCRNLSDGSLEAFLEGERSVVDALEDWMRQGPPNAEVKTVVTEPQALLEPLLGESIETFEIRK